MPSRVVRCEKGVGSILSRQPCQLFESKYGTIPANIFGPYVAPPANANAAFHAHLEARYDAIGRKSQIGEHGQGELDHYRRAANERICVFRARRLFRLFTFQCSSQAIFYETLL